MTTAGDEEINQLIKLADSNGDKKVTFEDFCEAVHHRRKFKVEKKAFLISVPHWGEVYRLSMLNKEKG